MSEKIRSHACVELTKEEKEVFDKIIGRLRAAMHLPSSRVFRLCSVPEQYRTDEDNPWNYGAEADTDNFHIVSRWDSGDGMSATPWLEISICYKETGEHCDGRGFRYLFPMRRGPDGSSDRLDCVGCVACRP